MAADMVAGMGADMAPHPLLSCCLERHLASLHTSRLDLLLLRRPLLHTLLLHRRVLRPIFGQIRVAC